jgi:conjugative transfer signal peptidase TraF
VRLPRTHAALLGLGGTIAVLGLLGFRFNLTRSLPLGVYRTTAAAVARGSIVHVCLPGEAAEFARERGYLGPGSCASGVRPLGKMVLALGGDVLTLQPAGIQVNGVTVPHSATVERDSRGRALPHHPWGEYRLQPGELWLFSPCRANAYDSRYFGPVRTDWVVSGLKPVWTWRGRSHPVDCEPGLAGGTAIMSGKFRRLLAEGRARSEPTQKHGHNSHLHRMRSESASPRRRRPRRQVPA